MKSQIFVKTFVLKSVGYGEKCMMSTIRPKKFIVTVLVERIDEHILKTKMTENQNDTSQHDLWVGQGELTYG